MKTVIYTCITGGYEIPTDNFKHRDGYDYILFSDKPIKTNSWKNKLVEFKTFNDLPDVKKQRFVKLYPHLFLQEYEISVWIDANTAIDDKLYEYIEKNKEHSLVFKKHPERTCIYQELVANVTHKKEKESVVLDLIHRYSGERMPIAYGLFETNIIIRHHNIKAVQKIMELWFTEIRNNSHRDQLSLTYVLWKNNLMDIVTVVNSLSFHPKVHKKGNK